MRVTDIELIPVSIPMRPLDEALGVAPYIGGSTLERVSTEHSFSEALSACEGTGTTRSAVLVRLQTDEGIAGWGEMPGPL